MDKSEANNLVNKEIKKRDKPSGHLAPVGDGKIIFRVMNNEAREKLLERINLRMDAMNSTLVWKLKYALDKAEFARNHVLTEDPEKVKRFLQEAAKLVAGAIVDLQVDVGSFYNLADVAGEIKKSEEKNETA